MIDIENNSFNLGLPGYIINSIQCNLEVFDNKENSFISIALYDNTNIYFFHMNKGECKITLMNDLNDAFCPLSPSQMYFNVISQRKEIDSLFEKINLFIASIEDLKPSLIMVRATPRTAQLVVISGRYTPRASYRLTIFFFKNISTNCTRAAITRINTMVCRYWMFNGVSTKS